MNAANQPEHINGAQSQADKAVKLIGFNVALTDCARRLKETGGGAVGVMAFVLYPDGSCAFKPVGQITPGLCKLIAAWGVENLAGAVAAFQQQALKANIQQAVRPDGGAA